MTLRQKVLITYKAKKFSLVSDILIVIYIESKKKVTFSIKVKEI